MDRSVETILADWRSATDERQDVMYSPELEARIETLRREHMLAIDTRRLLTDHEANRPKGHIASIVH